MDQRSAPTTSDPTAPPAAPPGPDPGGLLVPARTLARRALHRAGSRLVDATVRARADQLADRTALAAWARAYGHDLLVFHRVDLAVVADLVGDPVGASLRAAMATEHDELAGAAAEVEQALDAWAGGRCDGRAAVAAVRAQFDDLVVHDAHEGLTVEAALAERLANDEAGGRTLAEALHTALSSAPLTDPPFLGPLTLADADLGERHVLLGSLPQPLVVRWTAAEALHAEATRRAMGA